MVVLVTSNEGKYFEFKKILGDTLKRVSLDLEEIQSLSLEEVSKHKAKQAYAQLKEPVIVEDTGLFLDAFNGLPGPFVKFFYEELGKDYAIRLLRAEENRNAIGRCVITYYDGVHMQCFIGEVKGTITRELTQAKDKAFGFDFCFVPQGYTQTLAELGIDIKNKISHRANAVLKFQAWHLKNN